MNWKQMESEVAMDITKMVDADTEGVRTVAAIIQWRGEIIGRTVYAGSPFELVGHGGKTHGMGFIPEPPADDFPFGGAWKRVDLNFVPKVNGEPSREDAPLAYFVSGRKGNGFVIPARYNHDGRVGWVHSEEIIDRAGAKLLEAGVLSITGKN